MNVTHKANPEPPRIVGVLRFAVLASLTFAPLFNHAQPTLPPDALQQFQEVVGNRIEAVNILGGDYAAMGGIYTFRGGSIADLSISKIGGSGDVASAKPLGIGSLQWAPVLQGNLGMVTAENECKTG